MKIETLVAKPIEGKSILLRDRVPHNPTHASTISRGKKGSVYNCLLAPWYLLKAIVSFIWSLFTKNDPDGMDWLATAEVFETIYTAVLPSEHGTHATDRQKVFDKEYQKLSKAAKERFRRHVCTALASQAGKKTGQEVQSWIRENGAIVKMSDYTNVEKNQVLKSAVKTFQAEIEKNL